MKKIFYLPLVLSLVLGHLILTAGCSSKSSPQKPLKSYVAQYEILQKNLHFLGTIQPIRESMITSPVNGVIQRIHYHYGEFAKQGAVIFTLSSAELQKQYQDILTEFLKAKDTFNVAKIKFTGTQTLWDAGLLSKNNYLNEKLSFNTARVSLLQTKRKLFEMLEKLSDDNSLRHLSTLEIAEYEKVKEALTAKHHLINLKASLPGLLLYPPKTTAEEKSDGLKVGSEVKAGQTLALMGDLSGLSIEIEIPEIDVNQVDIGMPAEVSCLALGTNTLAGKVIAIQAQASTLSASTLPSFKALIEVPHLSEEEVRKIKVGMSASVSLQLAAEKKLMVPLAALQFEQNRHFLQVETTAGKREKRWVKTGIAEEDKVAIENGLGLGEKVLYG